MLIFSRHGQTEHNVAEVFQGLADSPLTKKGIEQGKKLNTHIKNQSRGKPFTVYHSPLPRAKHTTELATETLTCIKQELMDLREVCYGDWEELRKSDIDAELFAQRESERFTFMHPGSYNGVSGESYADLYKRLLPYFQDWEKRMEIEDIIIISHGGVLTCALKYFGDPTDKSNETKRLANNEILFLEKKDGKTMLEIVSL